MKLVNLRLGFANNSSSSHSMVVIPSGGRAPREDYEEGNFGWNNFTLTSQEAKWDYLACLIYEQLCSDGEGEEQPAALALCRELLGQPEWEPQGYGVDHQSVFRLPLNFDGVGVNARFAAEFKAWLGDDRVVILGGNDNDDGHPLAGDFEETTPPSPFAYDTGRGMGSLIARKDELSGLWTLFDRASGAKARLDLTPGQALRPLEGEAPKSGLPELVDVKITDFCDIGCGYCYQGSTEKGAHARFEDLERVAARLAAAQVFEVALGGGETTRHPRFVEVLELFASYGVTPNFTTRDLSFLKDPDLRARALRVSPSFAVSVSSSKEAQAALDVWEQTGGSKWSRPMSFQYVMGSGSDEEFDALLALAFKERARVTLLGYKDVGRGSKWREIKARDERVWRQQTRWIEAVAAASPGQAQLVSIDTALARESAQAMAKAGVSRALWHESEGLVSMYVDAVAMTMSPSSYETEGAAPFGPDWLDRFAAWAPTEAKRRGGPA